MKENLRRDTAEDVERLVARVVEQSGWKKPPERLQSRTDLARWRGRLLVVLLCWLAGVLAWHAHRSASPEVVFTADEQEAGLRFSMLLAIEAVERYRAEHGALPRDLASLGVDDSWMSYEVVGEEYRLVGSVGGVSVAYEAGDDVAPFRNAYWALTRQAEG